MTLPLIKVFRPRTPAEAIALCSRLLEYTPTARLTPLEACAHSFFDELRDPNVKLPNGREKPSLFNFTTQGTNRTPHSSSVDVLFTVGPLQPLATSTKLQRALKGRTAASRWSATPHVSRVLLIGAKSLFSASESAESRWSELRHVKERVLCRRPVCHFKGLKVRELLQLSKLSREIIMGIVQWCIFWSINLC